MNVETTKVKFIRELDVWLLNTEFSEDERTTSFTICECMKCHWTFVGDCNRQGYGYTNQGVQVPNYCPMCGSKFDGDLLE
jgi:rubrerythrin